MSAASLPERAPESDLRGQHLEQLLDPDTILALRGALTLQMRESLMQTFEAGLPRCVEGILDAARSGDQIGLKSAAHLLKGSAATLGANRLRLVCQRLEHPGEWRDAGTEDEQLEGLEPTVSETLAALQLHLLAA